MDKNKYRTSHQGVAAYFLMEAATLLEVGNDPNLGRTYFVFDIPVDLGRKQAKNYFDGNVQVDANAFYVKLTEIRGKIYEMRKKLGQI